MNKKLNHLVKNYAHAIMLLFMGIFYFRLILTHGIHSYDILKNVILGKMALKPITITLFEMTLFDAFYVVFPLLVSYLIYKKITLFGFFLGFILQWIIFLNTNP